MTKKPVPGFVSTYMLQYYCQLIPAVKGLDILVSVIFL